MPPRDHPKGRELHGHDCLKGKPDIGDKINTQIIRPLIDSNARLARSDFPDFNDLNKLGEGQAMVDRLTNLVGILKKPELDFSQNRADHDEILGDAYEYWMRPFAKESAKSNEHFYTLSKGSRTNSAKLQRHAAESARYRGRGRWRTELWYCFRFFSSAIRMKFTLEGARPLLTFNATSSVGRVTEQRLGRSHDV